MRRTKYRLEDVLLIIQEQTYLTRDSHENVRPPSGSPYVDIGTIVYVISAKKRTRTNLFDAVCLTPDGIGWIVLSRNEVNDAIAPE